MKRFFVAVAVTASLAWLGVAYAQFGGRTGVGGCSPQAQGPNGCGPQIGGGPQTPGTGGGGGGGGSNFILMIDNTSRILQTDNVSKICLATGC